MYSYRKSAINPDTVCTVCVDSLVEVNLVKTFAVQMRECHDSHKWNPGHKTESRTRADRRLYRPRNCRYLRFHRRAYSGPGARKRGTGGATTARNSKAGWRPGCRAGLIAG